MFWKLYNQIGKLEVSIAKLCVAVLTVLVFTSAVARKIGHPQAWTVDIATFLFAWCVFLGADAAMRRDGLVSIDLLVSRLPRRGQDIMKIINNVIIIVFLVIMIIFGFYLSYTTRFRTFSGLPWLSYTWVTVSVPLGSLLMLITITLKTQDLIFKKEGEAK